MRNNKNKLIFLYILIITIISAGVLCINIDISFSQEKKVLSPGKDLTRSKVNTDKPEFVKQGELKFFNKKKKKGITRIDIEIADSYEKRAIGLMNRKSIPDNAGMLFVFEQSNKLFFWMINTYIPLDIIFIDEDMQIVTIQKNTKPLSDKLIPSYKKSKYVVEVNSGFCDKYGINVGDYIIFNIL